MMSAKAAVLAWMALMSRLRDQNRAQNLCTGLETLLLSVEAVVYSNNDTRVFFKQ